MAKTIVITHVNAFVKFNFYVRLAMVILKRNVDFLLAYTVRIAVLSLLTQLSDV